MKKKGKYDTEETSSRRAEGFARGTRGARGNRGEGGNGDTGDTGMADTISLRSSQNGFNKSVREETVL